MTILKHIIIYNYINNIMCNTLKMVVRNGSSTSWPLLGTDGF